MAFGIIIAAAFTLIKASLLEDPVNRPKETAMDPDDAKPVEERGPTERDSDQEPGFADAEASILT